MKKWLEYFGRRLMALESLFLHANTHVGLFSGGFVRYWLLGINLCCTPIYMRVSMLGS